MTPIDKSSLLFRHCKTEEAYLNARARIDRDRKDKTAAARAAMDAYDRRGPGDDGLVAELLQAQKGADLELLFEICIIAMHLDAKENDHGQKETADRRRETPASPPAQGRG